MTNYIYDDDAAPLVPEGHDHPRERVVRQHEGEQEQPRSGSVGRLRRPHRRRDGARLDERRLSHRRRVQGACSRSARRRHERTSGRTVAAARSEDVGRVVGRGCPPRGPAAGRRRLGVWRSRRPCFPASRRSSSARASPARSRAGSTTRTARHSFLVGYFNRNLKQALDVPIGPNNRIEPGGPDLGQPTHFCLRAGTGMFIVPVPKELQPRAAAHVDADGQRPDHADSAAPASPTTSSARSPTSPSATRRRSCGSQKTGPASRARSRCSRGRRHCRQLSARRSRLPPGSTTTGSTRAARTRRCATAARRWSSPGRSTADRRRDIRCGETEARGLEGRQGRRAASAAKGTTLATFSAPGDYVLHVARERLLRRGRQRRSVLLDERLRESHRQVGYSAIHNDVAGRAPVREVVVRFPPCDIGVVFRQRTVFTFP